MIQSRIEVSRTQAVTIQQPIALGIEALGITLPDTATAQLATYVDLLARWNRVFNLTAVRDPQAMVPRHILDSLAILPWLRGPRVLDVGSGAGLPGIPLAVAQPDLQFCLLDSNGKRTRFLQQAVTTLRLDNVEVMHCRVEHFAPPRRFDSIVSRAVASLDDMLKWCKSLCQPNGQLLAMKGPRAEEERAALTTDWSAAVHALQIPGLDVRHHLVVLSPGNAPSPSVGSSLEETVDSHLQADD